MLSKHEQETLKSIEQGLVNDPGGKKLAIKLEPAEKRDHRWRVGLSWIFVVTSALVVFVAVIEGHLTTFEFGFVCFTVGYSMYTLLKRPGNPAKSL